jgi:glycosyltransferase involved in cell wall biosynthesis
VSWDVDFSLALYNRTGKYFIGRDIIEDQADLIHKIYYWRLASPHIPTGIRAKLIGYSLSAEITLRNNASIDASLPRRRTNHPTLQLDPFTARMAGVGTEDVVLCHDIGPVCYPDLFSAEVHTLYVNAYDYIAKAEPRLVFVSEASRASYESRFGSNPASIVIYPPMRQELDRTSETPVAGVEGPFLLTVGSIGTRKNQMATIRAFGRSGLAKQGARYILCGTREPGYERVIAEAAATPNVTIFPYVSDAELSWLYANAAGFVLVSRLEGFGMPVAEAMRYGIVPLITAGGALEEVAGAGAITAEVDDEEAIAEQMRHLVAMPEHERDARVALLRSMLKRFSREAFKTAWSRVLTEPV